MIFFNGLDGPENVGRVTVLERDGAPGSLFEMGKAGDPSRWGDFYEMRAIITEIGLQEAVNAQFLHTLGERIYLYPFGDRIGQMTLGGVAFQDVCNGEDTSGGIGLTRVLRYYHRNRVNRRKDPIMVTLDPTTVVETYLLGIQARMLSTAERLYQFSFNLALLPPDDEPEAWDDETEDGEAAAGDEDELGGRRSFWEPARPDEPIVSPGPGGSPTGTAGSVLSPSAPTYSGSLEPTAADVAKIFAGQPAGSWLPE